jgi:hypothetical protein
MTLALGAFASAALAQESSNSATSGLRPFIGAGYSWGGNTIQHTTLTPKGTATHYQHDISAGAGLDIRLGLSYRLGTAPVSIQASYGFHNDQVSGVDNESSFFRRYPLEALLQWHTSERSRVGFGLRKTMRATFGSKGGTYTDSTGATQPYPDLHEPMRSSTGLILEGEFDVTPNWGFKARYVHENYRFKNYPDLVKYEGNHVGILTVYYFN